MRYSVAGQEREKEREKEWEEEGWGGVADDGYVGR